MKTISFAEHCYFQWRSQGTWLAFVSFVFLGVFTCLARIHLHNCQDPNTSPNNTRKVLSHFHLTSGATKNTKTLEECSQGRLTQSIVLPSYPKMHLRYRPIGTQLGSTVQKRRKISQGLSSESLTPSGYIWAVSNIFM